MNPLEAKINQCYTEMYKAAKLLDMEVIQENYELLLEMTHLSENDKEWFLGIEEGFRICAGSLPYAYR